MCNLFPDDQVTGVFRGVREGGREFRADLVFRYRNDFNQVPIHGQFVLVRLGSDNEAVLGRIASFSGDGKLSSEVGEDYALQALRGHWQISEEVREQYLKYHANIRLLGVLRNGRSNQLHFAPSHRRFPHVGSFVSFPSPEVLREICGHHLEGAEIGHFALGEYIYCGDEQLPDEDPWLQAISPKVLVRFDVESLVARRTFVFARAGYGKSNLVKLLFSSLYKKTPHVTKRGNRQVPVGTVIFDRDGEYFWPDDKGRPGLCDVPHLQDKFVVFTPRASPSPFYGSFVAGSIKLDIRQLPPSDVISVALAPERQDQQNVAKLRGLTCTQWADLVDLIDRDKGGADLDEIGRLLKLNPKTQEMEAIAARSNMTNIVSMLHDKSSQFMGLLLHALSKGKLCVVDISQLRSQQALVLSGLVLRRIFARNDEEFTKANPRSIPVIAVVEEAQSVLNDRHIAADPYITWVKEGRKFDLGVVLITQQPGSIPGEILSQGDSWFLFHLLSSDDLNKAQRANAHFSDDLLGSLVNEAIPGHGVFWSSVAGKPYPVSMRAMLFEKYYSPLDPSYAKDATGTFAHELKQRSDNVSKQARPESECEVSAGDPDQPQPIDIEEYCRSCALTAVRSSTHIQTEIQKRSGIKWFDIQLRIAGSLPDTLEDKKQKAHQLLPITLDGVFGPQREAWHAFHPSPGGKLHVRLLPTDDSE